MKTFRSWLRILGYALLLIYTVPALAVLIIAEIFALLEGGE